MIARRVPHGPAYAYPATIEELRDVRPINAREAYVWRNVTHHFSMASGQTVKETIKQALSFISSLMGPAHVFSEPNF